MIKRGRPRKKGGSKKVHELREQWRDASAKYYGKNKRKINKKSKQRGSKKKGKR